MAKTDKIFRDDEMAGLFEAARNRAPLPSADLIARILADAEAQAAPEPVPAAKARRAPPAPGFWATLVAGLGGWPVLAGMATATVAGVWLGFPAPEVLDTMAGGILMPGQAETGYQLEDMVPDYGDFTFLLEEG
jgi:hypothetical protein